MSTRYSYVSCEAQLRRPSKEWGGIRVARLILKNAIVIIWFFNNGRVLV